MRGLERPIGLAFDLEGACLSPEERAGRITRREADGSCTALVSGIKRPRWLDVGEDATVVHCRPPDHARHRIPEPDDESAEPEVVLALDRDRRAHASSPTDSALCGASWPAMESLMPRPMVVEAIRGRNSVVLRIPVLPGVRAGGAPTRLGAPGSFAQTDRADAMIDLGRCSRDYPGAQRGGPADPARHRRSSIRTDG